MSGLRILRAGVDRMTVEVPPFEQAAEAAATTLYALHAKGIRGRIVYRQVVRGCVGFEVVRMPADATLTDMFVASGLRGAAPGEPAANIKEGALSWALAVARGLGIDRAGRVLLPCVEDLRAELAELPIARRLLWTVRLGFSLRAGAAVVQAAAYSLADAVVRVFRTLRTLLGG